MSRTTPASDRLEPLDPFAVPPQRAAHRRPANRLLPALAASLVGIVALLVTQVTVVAPRVESDLDGQARAALQRAGVTGVAVRVDGRDVSLSGRIGDGVQLSAAKDAVAAVPGVRRVDATGILLRDNAATAAPTPSRSPVPTASPTSTGPTAALRTSVVVVAEGGRALVAGGIPDRAAGRGLTRTLERTYGPGDVTDSSAVNSALTTDGVDAVAATLAALGPQARAVAVVLHQGRITVAARVADEATRTAALQAAGRAVSGPRLVQDKITVGSGRATATDVRVQLTALPPLGYGADQVTPGPVGRGLLAAVAFVLDAHPDSTVTLVGHSESTGDATADTTASLQRAREAEAYLASLGIRRSRVLTKGVGSSDPALPGRTAAAAAANRRVVVIGGS